MTGFPNSPRLVKGGIVTMDPDTSTVQSVIALQYNPDSLTRTLQIQAVPGGQDGVRVDALRLRGPAVETIKLEAELDATDQLEFPKQVSAGGAVSDCSRNWRSSKCSSIRPLRPCRPTTPWPTRAPWKSFRSSSRSRCSSGAAAGSCPCGLTDFSITEEAFDVQTESDPRQGQSRAARAQRR